MSGIDTNIGIDIDVDYSDTKGAARGFDGMTQSADDLEKGFDGVSRGAKDAEGDLDKFSRRTLAARESVKGLVGFTGKLVAGFSAVAGALGLIGFGALVKNSLDAAEAVRIHSLNLNISTEELTKWQYAAGRVGLEGDKMADIFKDMNDRVGDFARTGAGPLVDVMEQTNLKIKDLIKLSPDKQLNEVWKAIDKIQGISFAEKTFFLESFAGDASRLIPLLENNSEKFDELASKANRLNIVMSDLDVEMLHIATENSDSLGKSIAGVSNMFTFAMSPAISTVTGYIDDLAIANGGWGDVANNVALNVVKGFGWVLDVIDDTNLALLAIERGALKTQILPHALVPEISYSKEKLAALNATKQKIDDLGDSIRHLKSEEERLGSASEQLIKSFEKKAVALREDAEAAIKARKENRELKGSVGAVGKELKEFIALQNSAGKGLSAVGKQAQAVTDVYMKYSAALVKERNAVAMSTLEQYKYELQLVRIGKAKEKLSELDIKMLTNYKAKTIAIKQDETTKNLLKELNHKIKIFEIDKKGGVLAVKRAELYKRYLDDVKGLGRANADKLYAERQSIDNAQEEYDIRAKIEDLTKKIYGNIIDSLKAGGSINEGLANIGTTLVQAGKESGNAMIAAASYAVEFLGAFFSSSVTQAEIDLATGRSIYTDNSIANLVDITEDTQYPLLKLTKKMSEGIASMDAGIISLSRGIMGVSGGLDLSGGQFVPSSHTSALGFSQSSASILGTGLEFVDQTLGQIMDNILVSAYESIKKEESSWWGLSQSTSLNTSYTDLSRSDEKALTDVFRSGYETILSAALSFGVTDIVTGIGTIGQELGGATLNLIAGILEGTQLQSLVHTVGIEQYLQESMIDLGKINLIGLSAAEAATRISQAISEEFSLIITSIPELSSVVDRYAQNGEEAMETLIRTSIEYDQASHKFNLIGKEFSAGLLTNHEQVLDIVQNFGGLEKFTEYMDGYVDKFYSSTEKFTMSQANLANSFDVLGVAMPNSIEGYRLLVEGIDTSTEAGASLYTNLVMMSDGFYTFREQINEITDSMFNLGLNLGFGDEAIAAAMGLAELSGGLDNFLSLQQNYVSKLFTEEEQLLINQGKAAQSIASIAAEYGLAANDLDSASELRAQIELLNAGGLATAEAQQQLIDLLGIVDDVVLLDEMAATAATAAAELATQIDEITDSMFNLGLNLGFGDEAIAAAMGLAELSGGLDNFLSLQQNYVSKLFTEEEQLLINQGKAAQSIASIAAEYGLAANDLDSASELRAQIELLNAGGLATAEAQQQLIDLLGIVDDVVLLDEMAATAATSATAATELAATAAAELATQIGEITDSMFNLGLNLGFGDEAIAAAMGLAELSGGLDNFLSLQQNYVSKLFTEDEQLLINQGKAAQSIASIAAEYGLAANDLDSASELRAQIELLNAGGLATADAQQQLIDLLGIVDDVVLLDEMAATAATSAAAATELAAQIDEITDSMFNLGLNLGFGDEAIAAAMGLAELSGGLDNFLSLQQNYVTKLFTEEEQLLINQGKAAQSIASIAAEYGLAANDLDSASELRAQIELLNAGGLATAEAQQQLIDLLGIVDEVALLDEKGLSATSALAGVPEVLRDIIGGVTDLTTPYEELITKTDEVVYGLSTAVDYTAEIADNINNIIAPDFSNDLQDQLDAQQKANDLLAKNNDLQQQNIVLLVQIAASQEQIATDSSMALAGAS